VSRVLLEELEVRVSQSAYVRGQGTVTLPEASAREVVSQVFAVAFAKVGQRFSGQLIQSARGDVLLKLLVPLRGVKLREPLAETRQLLRGGC
jgi:hypothetical protein